MPVAGKPFRISPAVDRWNAVAFGTATMMGYLAAPVVYIGMVQAALCARLGGNATISNLPMAMAALSGVVPLLATWWIPFRYERWVVTASAMASSAVLALTGAGLLLPLGNGVRLVVVVAGSLLVNLLTYVQQVYLYQCLSRGTTEQGRTRTLQVTFALGPLAAVAGSLGAQALLDGRWLALPFPANFAAVYLLSIPCILVIALAGVRQRVVAMPEVPRMGLAAYLAGSFRDLARAPALLLLAVAYALTCAAVACEPNLTLYVQSAVGKRPELLVGYIMAVRFTGKSIGGMLLGWVTFRWGAQAALLSIAGLTAAGCLWALLAAGVPYFVCFALLGAGELAGAYFPNYCLSISAPEMGVRNLAMLSIFASMSGAGGAAHGVLADTWGYPYSFVFGAVLAGAAALLVVRLNGLARREKRG